MEFKNAKIIDVRTPMEYAGGHIQGSINIPLDTLPSRLAEIMALTEPLVLCCASGMRSMSACQYLKEKGLNNVTDAGPWYNVPEIISE